MLWALLIRIFMQKIKKLMMKSRKNAKKTGFSGIFPAFSAGRESGRKSGSVTFWALPFCIFVPKIRKKLMSQSREKLVTVERTDKG